jgi:hypothetical protein
LYLFRQLISTDAFVSAFAKKCSVSELFLLLRRLILIQHISSNLVLLHLMHTKTISGARHHPKIFFDDFYQKKTMMIPSTFSEQTGYNLKTTGLVYLKSQSIRYWDRDTDGEHTIVPRLYSTQWTMVHCFNL